MRGLSVKIMGNSFEIEAEWFYENNDAEEDETIQRMNKHFN